MEVQETYETPEQVLEAMRQGYARYMENLAEARSTGVGERFSFYLQGTGNPKVNQLVLAADPEAFIVVSQINEVRGRGFTLSKVYRAKKD